MITLYYHRGACSTSNHFALEEAGIQYEAIEVDLKKLDDPLVQKVRAMNPMAQTPVLVLPSWPKHAIPGSIAIPAARWRRR